MGRAGAEARREQSCCLAAGIQGVHTWHRRLAIRTRPVSPLTHVQINTQLHHSGSPVVRSRVIRRRLPAAIYRVNFHRLMAADHPTSMRGSLSVKRLGAGIGKGGSAPQASIRTRDGLVRPVQVGVRPRGAAISVSDSRSKVGSQSPARAVSCPSPDLRRGVFLVQVEVITRLPRLGSRTGAARRTPLSPTVGVAGLLVFARQ